MYRSNDSVNDPIKDRVLSGKTGRKKNTTCRLLTFLQFSELKSLDFFVFFHIRFSLFSIFFFTSALTVPLRLFLTYSYTDVCFRDRAMNRAKISAFYFWHTIHDPFCRVFTSSARLRNILEYRVHCDAFISGYFDALKCV